VEVVHSMFTWTYRLLLSQGVPKRFPNLGGLGSSLQIMMTNITALQLFGNFPMSKRDF